MNDRLSGQISYNSSLSNAFKLKLGHDVKLFLVQMMAVTGKDIAEHVISPVKVIHASLVPISNTRQLIDTSTLEGANENERVVDEEAGGKDTNSSNNVSSD
jgi:hypothetical protein